MQTLRSSIFVIGLMAAGLAALVATPGVSYAQSTLTAAQVEDIQAEVQAAIDAVQAQAFTSQDEMDAAMGDAIANVTVRLVNAYGSEAAEEITLLVVATANAAEIAGNVIGAGLGQAATQIAETDPETAIRIAEAVGAGGVEGILAAFNQTVVVYGRTELLTEITATPIASSSCDNPSCT